MHKLLISAAAIAILSAPIAMADDQDNNNNKHQGQHEKADRNDNDNGPDRSGDRGNKPDGGQGGGAMTSDGPKNAGGNAMSPDNNKPDRGNKANDNDNDRSRDRNNNNNNNDNDRVRGNDNDNNNNRTIIKNKTVVRKTVDRSVVLKFRANIRAPHRYHFARAYVRPTGWYSHRWVFGERLPRIFFAPDYFILDFSAYGLIEPWGGYEWVRYGDDALLIDLETGEVIRVEYDVFY